MVIVTKEEKEMLIKEIDKCKDCKFEEELGFGKGQCEYHRNINKFLTKHGKLLN